MIERHTVTDGDLLLARAIGSKDHLGKCVVVYPGKEKWAFDSHLMRVRLKRDRCEPEWLKSLRESAGGRHLFLQKTRQSAVQFNINGKEFISINVPLPPLEDQRQFLKELAEIRAMESEQAASRRRLDELFQSIAPYLWGESSRSIRHRRRAWLLAFI
jgi:type I restriction enzyme S subunit